MKHDSCAAVTIGGSAGSTEIIRQIIYALPRDLAASVFVVYHLHPESGDFMARSLNEMARLAVRQPEDKEPIVPGVVYMAPANYHLLVEWDGTIALSVDPPVHYSRPSIDVLFESAADVYAERLVGIILSGANTDGSGGMRYIKDRGGLTVVQRPESAEMDTMPRGAMAATAIDHVLLPEDIGTFITSVTG